jgi:hypothetical protein
VCVLRDATAQQVADGALVPGSCGRHQVGALRLGAPTPATTAEACAGRTVFRKAPPSPPFPVTHCHPAPGAYEFWDPSNCSSISVAFSPTIIALMMGATMAVRGAARRHWAEWSNTPWCTMTSFWRTTKVSYLRTHGGPVRRGTISQPMMPSGGSSHGDICVLGCGRAQPRLPFRERACEERGMVRGRCAGVACARTVAVA